MNAFRRELEQLIHGYSMESNSNTPDFILAQYLERCLDAFDEATRARDRAFDFDPPKCGR